MARNKSNKSYESRSSFQETPHSHTIESPYNGATTKKVDSIFAAAME